MQSPCAATESLIARGWAARCPDQEDHQFPTKTPVEARARRCATLGEAKP